MGDFLADYKAYYAARAKRYAGNPDFHYSAIAESNLNEAMQSCSRLEEFRTKLGNLNELCAIALVKDKCKIRRSHYEAIAEPIRSEGERVIFEKADNYNNVTDLVQMVGDESNKTTIAIIMDDISGFTDAWNLLELEECYSRALVPDKWKADVERNIKENHQSLRQRLKDHEEKKSEWKKGWRQNLQLIHETRHRRMLPYPENELEHRLNQYRSITKK